jgi:hypothetical protein
MNGWRDRLGAFERLAPDRTVYERAQQGPRREPPREGPSVGSRVLAGAVALAVAVGAGVFAWRAFEPNRSGPVVTALPPTAALGEEGSVLWPARSAEALAQLQEDADAGKASGRWRLSPHRVLSEFAEQVLGWWPSDTYEAQTTTLDEGRIRATLTRITTDCEHPDYDRGQQKCYPATEEIVLAQPVRQGDGGVWAIVEARSPDLVLDVETGQVLQNGDSVAAGLTVIDPLRAVVGAYIGDYTTDEHCSERSGTALVTEPTASIQVRVDPDRMVGTDCGEHQPAYVFAATAAWRASAGVDPMVGDSSGYNAVTAVPVQVQIPENAPPEGMVTYTDTLGWRVDVSGEWAVDRIDTQDRVTTTGASFTSPDGYTEVTITHREGGPAPDLLSDDSSFPVSLQDMGCDVEAVEACSVQVRGNGLDYSIVWQSDLLATQADIDAGAAIVDTLRFPAMAGGDEIGGWVPLGPLRWFDDGGGTPAAIDRLGVVYVLRGPGGAYALDLDPDGCGEGENETWDPDTLQIWIQCPDYVGTGDVRYGRFGNPDPRNSAEFSQPLHAYPVITAWNGTLLLYRDGRVDDLPEQRWP